MTRVQRGDERAFERLVALHRASVVAFATRFLGDSSEAQDIAQLAFIRLWKAADRYRPSAKFSAWLLTITRNLAINEYRHRQRRPHPISIDSAGVSDIAAEASQTPDSLSQSGEYWRAIDSAISALPDKQRDAMRLRRAESMSYEQIATTLRISLASVKSLLFRARTQLRTDLRDAEFPTFAFGGISL